MSAIKTDDDESIFEIEWLKKDSLKLHLYILYSILSVGVLPGIGLFYPTFQLRFITSPCTADKATHIVVKNPEGLF